MSREKKKKLDPFDDRGGGQLPVVRLGDGTRTHLCRLYNTYSTRVDRSSKSQHIVAGSTLTADPE
jgi:hypothetical protein